MNTPQTGIVPPMVTPMRDQDVLDVAGLDICDDFMAEPFRRFRARERAVVSQRLAELQNELEGLRLYPSGGGIDGSAAQ
jgi:hypothetical protein